MIKPVIKWAGGKRQILTHLMDRIPVSWERYYEPFVGGGALFIALYNQGRIGRATISDANPELVNLYRMIQTRPMDLVQNLKKMKLTNSREQYLELRNTFNRIRGDEENRLERAALFLYLNRHGYNGLWRVNRKGEFNVPFGRYKAPALPCPELIHEFSLMLGSVEIYESDFADTVRDAEKGDFVYFDPPYHPISSTSHFTAYNSKEFSYQDQVRLAKLCNRLCKRGVQVMVSNSHTPQILDLYRDFQCETVTATRVINSRGELRTGVPEVIITGYDPVEEDHMTKYSNEPLRT